jgi:hypothetical protein
MDFSDITHRVTDAFKRMTDRLTNRRGTQAQQPSGKGDASTGAGKRDKRDDMT